MDLDKSEQGEPRSSSITATVLSPLRKVETHDGVIINSEHRPTAVMEPLKPKHGRRKKKKHGMPPADPAATVIRGFETPITSGGESSDVSRIGSPMLKAQIGGYPMSRQSSNLSNSGGLSALKQQLDSLSLDDELRRPGLARVTSNGGSGFESAASMSSAASDSDRTETETYEVSLEHDFISPEVDYKVSPLIGAVEGGLRGQSIVRKMTASDFEVLKCLGKGAFGTVHLVKQHATGRLYAQKQFRKASLTVHKRLVEQTRTERNILESVNRHPFVVKLFYAFQDHEKLYLILEYAQGGELFTHLAMERMFTEDVASFYMAEMVLALEHLHLNVRVVYRDLKPENCLLDSEGHLLLTDFGLSKVALEEEDSCNSILGTIEYMAPEVVQGTNYGMAVDWWSLGAIGFDLLTGAPPFGGNNHAKIQQNIVKQKLQLPYFLGPDAKDLLTRLLRKEPNKRLGGNMPKDLQTIKQHRFFRKIDWKKLERRELEPPIRPLITDPELAENFAREFTDLPLSPTCDKKMSFLASQGSAPVSAESNPFGGFSFVASQSLLEHDDYLMSDE